MNNTQLLCTFCKRKGLHETVDLIIKSYDIVFDKIFVLADKTNGKELMCTYNISTGTSTVPVVPVYLENTISLHRKKETNTLYTINSLNFLIRLLNDGKLDSSFMVNWGNYRNSLLLSNEQGFRQIQTEIYEIVKIVHETP